MDDFPELQSPSEIQRDILVAAGGHIGEAEILDLKSRWNDTLPISRLPPEILLEIFETLASCVAQPPKHCYDDRKNPYTWIRCTHVCKYWRNLALAAPSLWRRVTPACDECMDTMVELAGVYIPLSIRYEHEPWLESKGTVQPEVSFNQYYNLFHYLLPSSLIETLEMPARADFPRGIFIAQELKTLVINGSFIEDPEIGPDDWEEPLFHRDGLPALRELVVRFGSPRTTWSLFRPTLQILDVHRMEEEQPVSKWLDALAEMPNLRKLRLVEVIASIDPTHPPELDNVATPLLQLDHLHLEDARSGATILQLMDHITTQAVHTLSMEVTMAEDVELSANEEQIVRLVRAMNAKRDRTAPYTLSVKTIDFTVHVRILIEIHAIPLKPKAGDDLAETPSSLEPYNQSLTLMVDHARVPAFTLLVLRELPAKLIIKLCIDVHFDASLLRPYFESTKFPWLRALEPIGKTSETILALLEPRQIPPAATDVSAKVDSTETAVPRTTVLFPALVLLHWIDVTWKPETITEGQPTLFDRLITILEQRKSHTRKTLTRVSIYGSPELTAEDVERLRSKKLAHKVTWSGWEDTGYHGASERWRLREILKDTRKEGMMLELQARGLRMIKEAREALQSDWDSDDDSWDEDSTDDEDEDSDEDSDEEEIEEEDEEEDSDEEEDTDDDDGDQEEEEGDEDEDESEVTDDESEDVEARLGVIQVINDSAGEDSSDGEGPEEHHSNHGSEDEEDEESVHTDCEALPDVMDEIADVSASGDEDKGASESGDEGEGLSTDENVSEDTDPEVSEDEEEDVLADENDSGSSQGSEEDEGDDPPMSEDEGEGASENDDEEVSGEGDSGAESGDEGADSDDFYSSE